MTSGDVRICFHRSCFTAGWGKWLCVSERGDLEISIWLQRGAGYDSPIHIAVGLFVLHRVWGCGGVHVRVHVCVCVCVCACTCARVCVRAPKRRFDNQSFEGPERQHVTLGRSFKSSFDPRPTLALFRSLHPSLSSRARHISAVSREQGRSREFPQGHYQGQPCRAEGPLDRTWSGGASE